MSINELRDSE
ncbi:hypothetical protein RSAG8_07278, partial [Rhizoctonia solani AG-8 WAC10335]